MSELDPTIVAERWAQVKAALDKLNGTTPSAVSLMCGYTEAELKELGGF